jgi:hypothetical protein
MSSERSYYERIAELIDRTNAGVAGLGREHPPSRFRLQALRRVLLAVFLLLLVLTAAAFIGDYAVLRYRMAAKKDVFGTVNVQRIYYMRLKNGKTEITPGEMESQSCVHSLFPHLDQSPCWYAARRTEKRVDI